MQRTHYFSSFIRLMQRTRQGSNINEKEIAAGITVKKSERSSIADIRDLSPLAATVAFSSWETRPFNSGGPPLDMAVSMENKNVR